MKKILLAVMAVAAIGFTSCGGPVLEQGQGPDGQEGLHRRMHRLHALHAPV